MDYLNYIFSDKKAFKFWIPFYAFIFLYIGIFVVGYFKGEMTNVDPFEIIYPIFFLSFSFISFFVFYTTGYINLNKQEKFLKEYSNQIDKDSIKKREVVIYRSSYTVPTDRMPGRATIKPKSKLDIFTVFEMENKIVLFGRTYDFGLLRRELCPIMIDIKNYENSEKYKYAVNPKISSINWVDNDMEIIFNRSLFGIRIIKLIDWKK